MNSGSNTSYISQNGVNAGSQHQAGVSQNSKAHLAHLTPEMRAEIIKRKQAMHKDRKTWPKIIVNEVGKVSSLSTTGDCREPLHMGDVQSLLCHCTIGTKSPVTLRWARLVNGIEAPHVVLVHIEGVAVSNVQPNTHSQEKNEGDAATRCESQLSGSQNETCVVGEASSEPKTSNLSVPSSGGLPDWLKTALPRTCQHMRHSLEVVAPSTYGACPVNELLQLKLNKIVERIGLEEDLKNYKKLKKENEEMNPRMSFLKHVPTASFVPEETPHPSDRYSRLKLLVRAENLDKELFPIPLPGYVGNIKKDFVLTSDNYKQVTSTSPMFGLDCEMCLTSILQQELCSISVVNEKLELVYHTLVLPYNKVVNYLTTYSGITPSMLKNCTKRLEDVQEDLQKLLPPDAILVGHSLNSDLKVLKMMHPYVIDSSLSYNLSGRSNRRSSLKSLCEMFLGEKIQTGDRGHDPTEDAAGSLKLIQLKLKKDEAYGDVRQGWKPPRSTLFNEGQFWQEGTSECEKTIVPKPPQQEDKDIGPFRKMDFFVFQLLEPMISVSLITTELCLKRYGDILQYLKSSSVEAVSGNKQVSQRACDFVQQSKLTYVHMEMGKKLSQCPDEATWQRQLTKLDKRLQRIHKASTPRSVHIYLFSGSSLTVPFRERSNGFVLVGVKDLPYRM